jgi:hypothetical protein
MLWLPMCKAIGVAVITMLMTAEPTVEPIAAVRKLGCRTIAPSER